MKRYITHQFPNELKTYALLTLASVLTVVAVTFFLSVSGFSQHVFKTFIVEHPILNFIITPITFVVIIYFAKQYCHFVQGSGIPQLIAATDSRNKSIREQLLSFRVAAGKIGLIFLAMLGVHPLALKGLAFILVAQFFMALIVLSNSIASF
ncbi:Chloride channel protein [uncultured Gammaproteobacteria bacterium]|nr:Chloride channel protein [uncultured Gammaproteobacteria bacterium]